MIGFDITTHIKRINEEVDNAVLGEIKEIAKENGLEREIILNEKNIVSALKKQIPKKATEETINRGIDISGEYDIDFNLCCPACGGVVGTFEGEVDEYFVKYCPNCGQALDWGDTE